MAKQLDPRMIGTNLPLVVGKVITNTLSAVDSEIDNLSAIDVQIQSLTSTNLVVTNNVTTNFLISTVTTNYIFTDLDNSKIFHFDTSTTPIITASFANDISNGFNVSIVNTGIGAIYFVANPAINAPGNINTITNTGVLVYKHNNQLYGVGVFE